MTKKIENRETQRPSKKRANEVREKTPAAQIQKDSLDKDANQKPKSSGQLRSDVTDKHHDS